MKKIVYILVLLIFITSIAAVSASDVNETEISDNIQGDILSNIDEPSYSEPTADEDEPINDENPEIIIIDERAYHGPVFPSSKPYPYSTQYYFTFTDANITENIETDYSYEFPLNITSHFTMHAEWWLVGGYYETYEDATTAQVYIDDMSVLNATISDGSHDLKIKLDEKIDAGTHEIKVVLIKRIEMGSTYYGGIQGERKYTYVNATLYTNLTVNKSKMHLSMNKTSSKENYIVPLIFNVKNDFGDDVKGIELEIFKNGEYIGNAISDKNGNAELDYLVPMNSKGTYNITAFLRNNENCFDTNYTSTLTVDESIHTKLNSDDLMMYYKDGSKFKVQLVKFDNKAIANETLILEINGKTYKRTTDSNGYAYLNINLNSGEYKINAKYINSGNYLECEKSNIITILPTITANDIEKRYKDNSIQFYANFYDEKGNALSNTTVEFNINGVIYKRETSDTGAACLNINLLPGNYIITSYNTKTKELHSNNITVMDSVKITSDDLIKYYKNDTQFTVCISDLLYPIPFSPEWYKYSTPGNIDTVGHKFPVTFNINGVLYNKTTDNKGYAGLNISLEPGKYLITTDYNGYKKSNNITVLSTLNAEDLKKNYRSDEKFNVTLVNGIGQAYANQIITFNINGVSYYRTTDENGIASLNINLMPGEYIITSTYGDLNIKNKITVEN